MLVFVLFTLLTVCTAKLGYQYLPPGNDGVPDYEPEPQELPKLGYVGDQYQKHADYQKHFYAFEAPYDSSEESERVERKLSAQAQKSLQVVFIKAPENKALEGALHAFAKQPSEDKTAIYVLNKQTDADTLASKLSALRSKHKHKPEVHFVKYRTDEEAAQAQQHIQAQYGGAGAVPALPEQPEQLPQLPQLPRPGYLPQAQPNYVAAPPAQSFFGSSSYPSQPNYVVAPTPAPAPHPYYGPQAPSYPGPLEQSHYDLPPVPLAQQELGPSSYDLDARTQQSNSDDFRVNERHSAGSRMIFPTDGQPPSPRQYTTTPGRGYLPPALPPSNAYLPPIKRKRRAHL